MEPDIKSYEANMRPKVIIEDRKWTFHCLRGDLYVDTPLVKELGME